MIQFAIDIGKALQIYGNPIGGQHIQPIIHGEIAPPGRGQDERADDVKRSVKLGKILAGKDVPIAHEIGAAALFGQGLEGFDVAGVAGD